MVLRKERLAGRRGEVCTDGTLVPRRVHGAPSIAKTNLRVVKFPLTQHGFDKLPTALHCVVTS